jgi:hypothetical protein
MDTPFVNINFMYPGTLYTCCSGIESKGKGKGHPRTGHEGAEVE